MEPLVGELDLPAVTDGLIEDPELVADAIADSRHAQRRHRVHVTGGQPAEAAVAEARLLFLREQAAKVLSGTGAEQAGLLGQRVLPTGEALYGDIILRVDGKPIRSIADIAAALRPHKVGDQIQVDILRDWNTDHMQELTLPLTLR